MFPVTEWPATDCLLYFHFNNLNVFAQEMLDLTKKEQLMKLVEQIVPSQMKHHAEAEACDLLMEVERLDILKDFVDQVHNNVH